MDKLFGPPPSLTAEQKKHLERVARRERELLAERIAAVQFFAPVLCCCRAWYAPGQAEPPQLSCPVHESLMLHPYTGQVVMPGIPWQAGALTPPGDDDDDDE